MYLPPMTEDEQAKQAAVIAAAQEAAAEEKRKRDAEAARLQQQILANSAQQTEAGNANIGISMQGVQQLLNENPDNPFVQKLAKLMQGNPVLDQLAAKSPADIEKAMHDQYWGAPKSKFGKIMQAIAKPLAVIGGAPTDFSGAAMKQYKDIQEMARRENRDDYLAAMAGSKSLIDLLKTKGSAAKTAATTGVSQVKLGQEGEKAVMGDLTKNRQQDITQDIQKDKLGFERLREEYKKLQSDAMFKRYDDDRAAKMDIAKMQLLGRVLGNDRFGGGMTSQTSRAMQNADGEWEMRPSSQTIKNSAPSGGGGNKLEQLLNGLEALKTGKIPQGINSSQALQGPANVPTMPPTPKPQVTSPAPTTKGPFKLMRTDRLTGQPWKRFLTSAADRTAEEFKREINTQATVAHTNLEQALEELGMEGMGATLNRMQAFGSIIGASNSMQDKSAQWRQIAQEFEKMPGKSGLALKNAAQAIGQLSSAVVKERSGTAASDSERQFIANFLPNAADFAKPYNFLITMNKFKAASDVLREARDLGLENLLPKLQPIIERQLNDYAYARANAFKENEGMRKAGRTTGKLPDLNAHELIWEAIQQMPDKDYIISNFGLKTPGSAGEKATEQFQGTLDKAKVDKVIMNLLKNRGKKEAK